MRKEMAVVDAKKLNKSALNFVNESRLSAERLSDAFFAKATDRTLVKLEDRMLSFETVQMARHAFVVAQTAPCKSDTELQDEIWEGKSNWYTVTFLTSSGEHAGTRGPFYIQFEGVLATTSLHSFYPWVESKQWAQVHFYDQYVGKMTKIRIAPGTSNGWGLYQFMVFYPREKLWLFPDTWIDSDGPNILELSL